MGRFEGIIFDMDGTLVESENVWQIAEGEVLAARGIDYTDEVRQMVIGLRLDEFFDKLIKHYGLSDTNEQLQAELIERMMEMIPQHVQKKAGAQALVEWTAAQGMPFCIASSSPMAIIEAVVQSQGWADTITHLYSADAVALGKPAPDVYLYAAEKLNLRPVATLAIEDSPAGARSAVSAGMVCYAVPDYHSKPEAFAAITPHVFPSLVDVLQHLQQA
jgi:HAD superfamily hydrolase (TIGR01509 family)